MIDGVKEMTMVKQIAMVKEIEIAPEHLWVGGRWPKEHSLYSGNDPLFFSTLGQ
jgi:hypothetical protein